MRTTRVLSAILCTGALTMAPGWAAVVLPVANGGFESPETGGATATVPTGWSYTGYAPGVWDVSQQPYGFWDAGVTAPEGNQVAYLPSAGSSSPASIFQVLQDQVLQPGFTYNLSGFVGQPKDANNESHYQATWTAELFLLTTAGESLLAAESGVGPVGSFGSFAFDYLAGANPASGFLGIRLISSREQTCFDGIRLTAVPEASTNLAGFGALGMLLVSAWKTRKAVGR